MEQLVLGGVPEHFNLPWHLGIEKGIFKKKNIDLNWVDFPGGTGAMCQALREKTIDAAVILTSGIIKDIIQGNEAKIVKVFVKSPLLWGIHVGAKSDFHTMQDLANASVAISRFGSGSHLMAKVNAYNQQFPAEQDYVLVKNLKGGIKALTNGNADYFMWEHFTTKPLVDKGIFRRIDSVRTPWPCFVLAVRNDILEDKSAVIAQLIKGIRKSLKKFDKPLENQALVKLFAKRYGLKKKDIRAWLAMTAWDSETHVSENLIDDIQNKLLQFGVIEHTVPENQLIHKVL